MTAYFQDRRRKFGVVTLVIALCVVAAWGGSQRQERSYSYSPDGNEEYTVWLGRDYLGLSKEQIVTGSARTNIDWSIKLSHWPIALPLALLSGWLLLSKLRQPKRFDHA